MNPGATVHTSAPPAADPGPVVHCTGTLRQNGEARTRQVDAQGNVAPVLCLEVEQVLVREWGVTLARAHIEQRFARDAYTACNAAAHRHKRGMHITWQHPVASLALQGLHTAHIHVVTTTEESTQ